MSLAVCAYFLDGSTAFYRAVQFYHVVVADARPTAFLVPPVGVISDSVLWYAAQTMIYAGSVFGVSVYVNERLSQFRKDLKKETDAKD